MSDQERRVLLAVSGLLLIATGHKLFDTEVQRLGLPHAVGAVLVTAALRS